MNAMGSQITVSIIAQSFVQAQMKEKSNSASQDFVMGIHRWPVNSRTKGQ